MPPKQVDGSTTLANVRLDDGSTIDLAFPLSFLAERFHPESTPSPPLQSQPPSTSATPPPSPLPCPPPPTPPPEASLAAATPITNVSAHPSTSATPVTCSERVGVASTPSKPSQPAPRPLSAPRRRRTPFKPPKQNLASSATPNPPSINSTSAPNNSNKKSTCRRGARKHKSEDVTPLEVRLTHKKQRCEELRQAARSPMVTTDLVQTRVLIDKWLDLSQQVLVALANKGGEGASTVDQWLDHLKIPSVAVSWDKEEESFI